jgi:hypothetical protein
MSDVAAELRAETNERLARLSPAERIGLALRLGEADAELFARSRGLAVPDARRLLARRRHAGRTPSRAADPDSP